MLENAPMSVQNIALIVEILVEIGLVFYILGTIMAYDKVKKLFVCKSCGNLNKTIHKKCSYCGKDMKQWVGIYITCIRQRIDCKNKDGFADYKKTRRYIIRDVIILIICTLLVSYVLALNITSRL